MAGAAQLRAGEYSLKVNGSQVMLIKKDGKQIETTAKLETADHKFEQTAVGSSAVDGTNRITFIELGGSPYRVTFQ